MDVGLVFSTLGSVVAFFKDVIGLALLLVRDWREEIVIACGRSGCGNNEREVKS